MSFLTNKYDPIESLIFEKGLRIQGIHFYPEMDLMVFVLNNKKVLTQRISKSSRLSSASEKQLNTYQLTGKGVGIYWPEVDEDISLKGLLKEELIESNNIPV